MFRQRGSVSAVLRKLRFGGPSFDEMGLPEVIRQLADEQRGLVLVTGPTGSGKTTTLAAMIEHLNHTRQSHIVTIEDPIEVLFRDDVASINQREVGNDTESFLSALRAALRQDPDVILIGEMRDTETVRTSLQAAETGHLVLSTLHTVDATETVNRVVDFFPPEQQGQIRLTLAGALKGIICQRLVPSRDGGMVPCHEVLVNTGRVSERISDADKTAEIHDVIAEGGYYGMCTFDQSLLQLVKDEKVTVEAALSASSNPHDFTLQLQQAEDRAAELTRQAAGRGRRRISAAIPRPIPIPSRGPITHPATAGAALACRVTVRTSTTGEGSGCENEETVDGRAVPDAGTVADDDRAGHPRVVPACPGVDAGLVERRREARLPG